MSKFQTYAITLRPQNGVSEQDVSTMADWIKRKSTYYHIVTEKEGSAKHLHAGIVLSKAITRSNLCQTMTQLYKGLSSVERSVFMKGIKIMYNIDWISSYLAKGDSTHVIASCLPEEGHIEAYFPKKEEPRSGVKCSAFYHELEALWYKHTTPDYEIHTMNARNFLFKMMYSERCINVIRDDKQIVQIARHLVRWLNKADESTIELAPFEKEE